MTQQITLGGRGFDLPRPTVPYLVELAEILDAQDGETLAAAVKRNVALVNAALLRADAGFDIGTAELSFAELNEAVAVIMEAAGFAWRTPSSGEAAPAAAGSQTSSTTSSAPSPPAADIAGPETTLN